MTLLGAFNARMTREDLIAAWDSNRPVWTVDMGGIGPSYEQALQILVMELIRDADMTGTDFPDSWGESTIKRVDKYVGGFTGAQVAAAKALAESILRNGYGETLKSVDEDRLIMVCRIFPQTPPIPDSKDT